MSASEQDRARAERLLRGWNEDSTGVVAKAERTLSLLSALAAEFAAVRAEAFERTREAAAKVAYGHGPTDTESALESVALSEAAGRIRALTLAQVMGGER